MAFQTSVASILVLIAIVIVEIPEHSAAKIMTGDGMEAADAPIGGFAADMMQYYHSKSLFNLTLEQRVEIAINSSLARGQYLHNLIYGRTSNVVDKIVFTAPLSTQGSPVIQIRLGTPARTLMVAADTTNILTSIHCTSCRGTSPQVQPDASFNPCGSYTYKPVPCRGNAFCAAVYGRCSAASTCLIYPNGELATDTLYLNTTSGTTQAVPNFVFECDRSSTQGTFSTDDGLVGLGQGNQSISIMAQLGSQIANVFSYCLVDFNSAPTKTSPFLLGSPGPVPLQYTPLVNNSAYPIFYYVNLVGIMVNGVAVQYPAAAFQIGSNGAGGLIMDLGTTLTLLDSRAYTPFKNRLQSLITYPRVDGSSIGFDLCYSTAGIKNLTFPTVTFQFQNVNVVLPKNNVFIQVDNAGDLCLAFQSSNFGISIFGSMQQQTFQIAFDRANKRIGFAPKAC